MKKTSKVKFRAQKNLNNKLNFFLLLKNILQINK
jgi:hypothetical protein